MTDSFNRSAAPAAPALPTALLQSDAPSPAPAFVPAAPAAEVKPVTEPALDATALTLKSLTTSQQAVAFFCEVLPPGRFSYDLMEAAVTGATDPFRNWLSRSDVLPDFSNPKGFTPLMAAAHYGHADIVEMLAAHPLVNLGRQNPDGWTALHFAAWANAPDCAHRLLTHYAPAGAKTTAGKTAYDFVAGIPAREAAQAAFTANRQFGRHQKRLGVSG